jgi:hypothetical protein
MAQSYRSVVDRCPYDIVAQTIAGCPRFTATVAFDQFENAIWSCAHARCAIDRRIADDGGPGVFYLRCALRTGDVEAERDFIVPLD